MANTQLEHIHHQASGGTIDSEWQGSADTAVPCENTVIPSYLEAVRLPRHRVTSATSFMKDSRNTTLADQDRFVAEILGSGFRKTMGTTGTYQMDQFAAAVREQASPERLAELRKWIALTGSAQPISGYLMSDGGFNVGMTFAMLQQELQQRLLLVMNGGVWDGFDNIRKDLTTATFHGVKGKNLLGYDGFGMVNLGGSIDFVPDGLDGMVPADESGIPHYLRDKVSLVTQCSDLSPFIKGSREMTEGDMDEAVDTIRTLTDEQVLVTMGLYEIRKVQEYLRRALKDTPDEERKVVLTGSRHPLNFGDQTDAPFNLGYSLGMIGHVQEGVHIGLNGTMMADDDNIFELIYTEEERKKLRERGVI